MEGIPHRYLTERYSGVGGRIKSDFEDFQVTEVPLYHPVDHGEHTYFEIEKVDLSTFEAIQRICVALDISRRELATRDSRIARALHGRSCRSGSFLRIESVQ